MEHIAAEIQALTKLEEFKTKSDKIDLAWCSCQKCCDNKNKSNKIYNMVSTNYINSFFTNWPWEGGMGMFQLYIEISYSRDYLFVNFDFV